MGRRERRLANRINLYLAYIYLPNVNAADAKSLNPLTRPLKAKQLALPAPLPFPMSAGFSGIEDKGFGKKAAELGEGAALLGVGALADFASAVIYPKLLRIFILTGET